MALNIIPLGYQQITSVSSAVGLTVPALADGRLSNLAIITPQTQAVRYRDDGTDPSATVGMPLAVGATLEYNGDLKKIKFFEQAASAAINVSYYFVN